MYREKQVTLSKFLLFLSCVYLYWNTKILLTPYLLTLWIFFHIFLFYLYDSYFQSLNHQFENERQYILKQSIHTRLYDRDDEFNCDICYDSISKGETYSELVCHCKEKFYHNKCIETWFLRKNICPFCRKQFQFL